MADFFVLGGRRGRPEDPRRLRQERKDFLRPELRTSFSLPLFIFIFIILLFIKLNILIHGSFKIHFLHHKEAFVL